MVSKIAQHGVCVMDHFLPPATIVELADEVISLSVISKMQVAGTGRTHKTINKDLRGDSIYWLNEAEATSAQQVYFAHMETLRQQLNQDLYLGLFALESHLALYTAGTGYKKHIDRFKGSDTTQPQRQISCILYLNQDWQDSNGGHLRLYLNPKTETPEPLHLDISPVAGRFVMFLSDTFYHEVLPATQDRMSLTAWFLTR
ncbi:MAG TPA: 2OG-Fe(II) oxygenase [Methylotenera sp.]|nr:2OG-Fe(II) oxygenase [Methylotenera sp.]